ncbi:hypothetical protein PRZ48_007058 [Zasmidium cellare]|uniref:CRIB domain-containing protein n=1 Tax=Zasmidium cellare TaxID=395010 RepID=A0ABR0EJ28_ZASCE|nr:hypothetical protein PRZ48_007058 [Zasmidium cellare]
MGTSQSNAGVDPLNPPPHLQRPYTAQSESKRRTTDPLGSIRNSIFGGRKHAAANDLNPPRPSSRQSQKSKKSRKSQSVDHSLIPFTQQNGSSKTPPKEGQFHSAKEYYRHHKKSSISPPFNFQHITHTARKHLPRLETVDEKDLSARFWAVNAYQKPKQHLTGIKAEDLGKRRERSLSPGRRPVSSRCTTEASDPSSSAAPHTVTGSVDETIFDETQETKFNPDDAYRSLEDVHSTAPTVPPVRRPSPKHYSSMSALSSPPSDSQHRHVRAQGSFDETRLSRSPPRPGTQRARTSLPVQSTAHKKLMGQSLHEKQPLPAIPQEGSSRKGSVVPSGGYSLFPAPPGQKIEYPASIKSETPPSVKSDYPPSVKSEYPLSVKSKRPSISVATLSSQKTDVLNESTWEDDIDFAYEQEAEAMCDFDWENASCSPLPEENEPDSAVPSGHPSPVESSGASSPSGGVRLSTTSTYQPSAFTSDSSIANRARSSSAATSIFSSTENVNQQHKRGSSVGHKGFAAARKTSTDVLSKSSPSLTLEHVPEVVSTATPPPTFSLTEADMETTKKSPTSTSYFPAMDPFVPGYLSDPESAGTDSSRHRKSSSYSSYQSSERSLLLGSDTTRWSSASTSSIPDLLHSKRKSRSSVAKHRISRPLESVPHSPSLDAEAHDEENLAVPSRASLWDKHDSLMMRRPDTPGDRQVLYSAGRTVQRGRSATPSRMASRPTTDSDEAGWI